MNLFIISVLIIIITLLNITSVKGVYVLFSRNLDDHENIYKTYLFPDLHVTIDASDIPKGDNWIYILGHGSAGAVQGKSYAEIFEHLDTFDHIFIMQCGITWSGVMKSTMEHYKVNENYFNIVDGLLVLRDVNEVGAALRANMGKQQVMLGVNKKKTLVNDFITTWRKKVVFYTDRVSNLLIWQGKLFSWLTPNDAQARELGFPSASGMGLQLTYDITAKRGDKSDEDTFRNQNSKLATDVATILDNDHYTLWSVELCDLHAVWTCQFNLAVVHDPF